MEYKGVMVLAEQGEGKLHPISFELLGKGREIADKLGVALSCVLLGSEIKAEASELICHGADKVFLYDHPSLKDFDALCYKQNIVNLVQEELPEILLIGATPLGKSLSPRVAVALETGLTADCIDLAIDEDGSLIQVRPAFMGRIFAYMKTATRPQLSTIRYKAMQPMERDPNRKGNIIEKEAVISSDSRVKIVGERKAKEANISDANIIVSCGRGLKGPEDFPLIEELARLLGGALGVSRPLVDEGWIGKEHQVGFSGNTVKPKLYIACGISGAPQHLAGMKSSDIIVAINTD
ncbi:MAG: electron transfer flavoprotein subunit alpha/FixB family protein, partial [Chloroflexota bacterium]|nr:electron transfer flavoprotein subunit alpha/FixB family protein [Chloroflexota bacterium]